MVDIGSSEMTDLHQAYNAMREKLLEGREAWPSALLDELPDCDWGKSSPNAGALGPDAGGENPFKTAGGQDIHPDSPLPPSPHHPPGGDANVSA